MVIRRHFLAVINLKPLQKNNSSIKAVIWRPTHRAINKFSGAQIPWYSIATCVIGRNRRKASVLTSDFGKNTRFQPVCHKRHQPVHYTSSPKRKNRPNTKNIVLMSAQMVINANTWRVLRNATCNPKPVRKNYLLWIRCCGGVGAPIIKPINSKTKIRIKSHSE